MSYSTLLEVMTVTVPEGRSGVCEVKRFVVSEEDASFTRMRAVVIGRGGGVDAGTYTALHRNGGLWMSDTPDERHDHMWFARGVEAHGYEHILINGLGLGMVVHALLTVPTVKTIDVCEIDPDVIALVAPHLNALAAERHIALDIRRGDAFTPDKTWRKGMRWDAVWSDIWETICGDDYTEHKRIRRIYARRCQTQDIWKADEVRFHATGR